MLLQLSTVAGSTPATTRISDWREYLASLPARTTPASAATSYGSRPTQIYQPWQPFGSGVGWATRPLGGTSLLVECDPFRAWNRTTTTPLNSI